MLTPKQLARYCIDWWKNGCVGLFTAFFHYLRHDEYGFTASMAEETWGLLHAWLNEKIPYSALL